MDLFEHAAEARARETDPDTSHEAAQSVSLRLREVQAAVLAYACANSQMLGFIDPDMNEHFGTTGSTYRTRRSELVAKGYISDTGERESRGKGRKFIVWAATKEGHAAHANAG